MKQFSNRVRNLIESSDIPEFVKEMARITDEDERTVLINGSSTTIYRYEDGLMLKASIELPERLTDVNKTLLQHTITITDKSITFETINATAIGSDDYDPVVIEFSNINDSVNLNEAWEIIPDLSGVKNV